MSESSLSITTTPPPLSRGEAHVSRAQASRLAAEGTGNTGTVPSGSAMRAYDEAGSAVRESPGVQPAAAQSQTTPADDQTLNPLRGSRTAPEEKDAEADPLARDELNQVVESINDYLQATKRLLEFSIDDTTGRTVIKVMDVENDQVIRQIPPEEALKLAARLQEDEETTTAGLVTEKA